MKELSLSLSHKEDIFSPFLSSHIVKREHPSMAPPSSLRIEPQNLGFSSFPKTFMMFGKEVFVGGKSLGSGTIKFLSHCRADLGIRICYFHNQAPLLSNGVH